jgi:poly(A) polymerase/tRNA nucleotidyltransferase (CCA-adding enzyme)
MTAAALTISPPIWLADPALVAVLDALPRARLVGGCVRDALAVHEVADIDLATPDTPQEVTALLARAGLRAVPTGLDHGTVTAVSGGRGFEVTTLRHDVETDGRHAVVAFTGDWREDAARRDFTFNALSMTRDGAVYDYFAGISDLRAGIVRFVGDPAARIAEDYLRILRFFRFHARYAKGPPDPAALTAIAAGASGLVQLSAERVWSELKRILSAPDPTGTVALMACLGVLGAVLPEAEALPPGLPPDAVLRLACMLPAEAAAVAARLHMSSAERDRLIALQSLPVPQAQEDDAALRRLLADTPGDILIGRVWRAGGKQALRDRLAAMPRPVFPLQGRDLQAAGVPPGPEIGRLLAALRAWWMESGCVADAAMCRAELGRILAG